MFKCRSCDAFIHDPVGRCPFCRKWGTVERIGEGLAQRSAAKALGTGVDVQKKVKLDTGFTELSSALGGGWALGSILLLGGQPGAGKSTLLLQACAAFPLDAGPVLYVSAEESREQIEERAKRIECENPNVVLLCESDGDAIEAAILKHHPALVVVDSLQAISYDGHELGSVNAMRETAIRLRRIIHAASAIGILVCHVIKDGDLAGPKAIEHYVDAVGWFEKTGGSPIRCLRIEKNRNGPAPNLGLFRMTEKGLVSVDDPAADMLASIESDSPGWALGLACEDGRIFLAQVQAMVGRQCKFPKIFATNVDAKRVGLVAAVLANKGIADFTGCELYVNVVGTIPVKDPGFDAAIAAALLSVKYDVSLHKDLTFIGEIGLLGEISKPDKYEDRIQVSDKYGFDVYQCKRVEDLGELFKPEGEEEIGDLGEEEDDEEDDDEG